MAYTASSAVTQGTPTRSSEYAVLSANTDWLKLKANVDHDFDNVTTATGKHKSIQALADSTYDIGTAALRFRVVYADTLGDTGQALAIAATSVTLPSGHAFSWNAGDVTLTHSANALAVAGGALNTEAITASGVLNIATATNWQLGSAAYTGSMANLNTLRDDSMADALHRHSELSASDGTPNPAVQVDAAGNVGVGGTPVDALHVQAAANAADFRLTDATTGHLATDGFAIELRPVTSALYLWNYEAYKMVFGTSAAERMILDSSGNLGIGVGPYGTGSTHTALYYGGNASVSTLTAAGAGNVAWYGINAQYDTDNTWEYISTDEAALFQMQDGAYTWYTAASGTAGVDITWINAMALTAASQMLIGTATASANAAGPSLGVAQGANDDMLFWGSSSDVAGGTIGTSDTDQYVWMKKVTATGGGLLLATKTDANHDVDSPGFRLLNYQDDSFTNAVKTGAGRAGIELVAWMHNSAGADAAWTADGNIFMVGKGNGAGGQAALFIVDEDGDLFADGGSSSTTMVTLYDGEDDAQLLRAYDLARSEAGAKGLIPREWDEFLKYNEDDLVRLGLLGAPLKEGGLTNFTRLVQAHNGAIVQSAEKVWALEERLVQIQEAHGLEIAELKQQLAQLQERN